MSAFVCLSADLLADLNLYLWFWLLNLWLFVWLFLHKGNFLPVIFAVANLQPTSGPNTKSPVPWFSKNVPVIKS